jgi:hypothetical protein
MEDVIESKVESGTPPTAPEPTPNGTVKTALLTAAGLAIGATLTETAHAQANVPTSGHIRIVVEEGAITLVTLERAIVNVLRQLQPGGCVTCGLVGFDLSILRGDPPFAVGGTAGGIAEGIETVR